MEITLFEGKLSKMPSKHGKYKKLGEMIYISSFVPNRNPFKYYYHLITYVITFTSRVISDNHNCVTIDDLYNASFLQKILLSATLSLDVEDLHEWRLRHPRLLKYGFLYYQSNNSQLSFFYSTINR